MQVPTCPADLTYILWRGSALSSTEEKRLPANSVVGKASHFSAGLQIHGFPEQLPSRCLDSLCTPEQDSCYRECRRIQNAERLLSGASYHGAYSQAVALVEERQGIAVPRRCQLSLRCKVMGRKRTPTLNPGDVAVSHIMSTVIERSTPGEELLKDQQRLSRQSLGWRREQKSHC